MSLLTITANESEPIRYAMTITKNVFMRVLYNSGCRFAALLLICAAIYFFCFFTDSTMDLIFIRECRADAWIGVYEWEQQQPQSLEFDIDIGLDTHTAGASDSIRDTIDYGKVVERVRADLKDARFKLLEALAEHVCQVLIRDFSAQWVKVSVAKIGHMRGVRKVGVTIARSAHDPALATQASNSAPPPGFADSMLS